MVVDLARQSSSFALPHLEMEEGFLGRRSRSKVAFLGSAEEPLAGCIRNMTELADAVASRLGREAGFQPLPGLQQLLLREPLARGERSTLSPGPLSEEEVERGLVEQYLGFLQTCRLSVLYVLEAEKGCLELYSQGSKTALKVPVAADTLVLFRSDELSYAYVQSGRDVALQGWVLSSQDQVALQGLDGDFEGLQEVFGGPRIQGQIMPVGEQVSIMTAACMIPGQVDGLDQNYIMYSAQTDTFLEIPFMRWDINLYYTSNPEESPVPKSYTKHAGLLSDNEITGFDNDFFDIPTKHASSYPPAIRLCLEKVFESLLARGYTRESLRGRNLPLWVADIGHEFDPFFRFMEDPDTWATARQLGMPSAGLIAYHLNTTGPATCVDTACSSSLVSSNLLYNYMRKRPDPTVTEAVTSSMMTCLAALTFVGLSGAGMLGRTGRCKSFDNSANGYARGEGIVSQVWKVAEDAKDVEDRLGVFVTGFVNQDGRSASLTAPNGPSQQLCVRSSLRLGGLLPAEIVCTENHGTGTALGDPIEVGSVRAVFWKGRDAPVVVTTGKSHQGHSEASAGLSGIMKTVNTIRHWTAPSQCHLQLLNAHIDDGGFPGLFPVECCNLNGDERGIIGGLNSFGFGGTNSRGEIWAMSRAVARRRGEEALSGVQTSEAQARIAVSVPCSVCQKPMCFLCGRALHGSPNHRCADIRAKVASYDTCSDCYTGTFHYQGALT
ncbi:ppsD [Symbiodinium pilosum]|uniref:PpsD protein n=1 Tax=Symbiodinium pilosum TaxID=2952 RepID=A0A812JYL5_SYMPI|nr:ppsD [Symbiodinium pilosum]